MLFNSFAYLFLFLPIVLYVYYTLNRYRSAMAARCWLAGVSLFFYGYWNPIYLPLIAGSVTVNYIIGAALGQNQTDLMKRKILLIGGVFFNLSLLGFFKYTDFMIINVNQLTGMNVQTLCLVLPLAISFFTFQQIAYLVDSYRMQGNESNFLNYVLFVTFFPQLIAGPIVHHREMIPQFIRPETGRIDYENLSRGLYLFCMGLFKKTVIADSLAVWANYGFSHPLTLNFAEAWMTSLSYTLQLYFDFSGYTDMAVGAALMLNIKLPINFDSPYKALNIRDFWRRWHITLGRFLRQYLYIPLGGNRKGEMHTHRNLLITFLLGGIWHGAGWTFVLWGALHGIGTLIHRQWQKMPPVISNLVTPPMVAWLLTFNFVNACWVIFRAANLTDAYLIIKAMTSIKTDSWSLGTLFVGEAGAVKLILIVVIGLLICIFSPNSIALHKRLPPKSVYALYITLILCVSLVTMFYLKTPSEFLYFQF
ncbi:MBOAT family protein [Desulfococcaceae bacterium HSG9]|nr:MBOAT family protein [Desulfococcaceae bacterium HSG9]